jgi:hypothetical protein
MGSRRRRKWIGLLGRWGCRLCCCRLDRREGRWVSLSGCCRPRWNGGLGRLTSSLCRRRGMRSWLREVVGRNLGDLRGGLRDLWRQGERVH